MNVYSKFSSIITGREIMEDDDAVLFAGVLVFPRLFMRDEKHCDWPLRLLFLHVFQHVTINGDS